MTTPFTYQLQNEYAARAATDSDIVAHLPTLRDMVLRYPQATVLELGTRSGNSTAAFLRAVDDVGGHLWSVDIDKPGVPGWWADTGLWTMVVGDDLAPDVIVQTPAKVDVLFIDTSHAYQHTLDELRTYVPRVAPGGVVLLHDTELESPDDRDPADPPFPVACALDAFCDEADLSWTNRDGCYGLGVLAIPDAGCVPAVRGPGGFHCPPGHSPEAL